MLDNNQFYIYLHTFSNGTCYIGKGKDKRAYSTKRNKYWHRLNNIYGSPKIEFLFYTNDENEAFAKEKEIIKQYKENNIKLCNLTDGGEGLSGYRFTMSQETKDKLSAIAKNRVISQEEMERFKKINIGRKLSEEHKKKISEKSKLQITTDSKREKLRQCNLGKKHSIETKEKIRKVKLGSIPPNKGIPCSEEQKKQISLTLTGRKNPNKDKRVFTFIHNDFGVEICTKWELYNKYSNLLSSNVSAITLGTKKSHKGWKVFKEDL